jgi:pimeloyl-ACP methyl ester carboxylesterase
MKREALIMKPKLFLLPGMGGDSRMFKGIESVGDMEVQPISYSGIDKFSSLIELSDIIINKYCITKESLLAGTSMGGMIALEIARKLCNPIIFIMGSCHHPCFINPILYKLSPLGYKFDWGLIHRIIRLIPLRFRPLVFDMYLSQSEIFYQNACKSVSEWHGVLLSEIKGKVFHIHGKWDIVIRASRYTDPTMINAGHLLTIEHPEIINIFIQKRFFG